MLVLTTKVDQIVQPGFAVDFDDVILATGKCNCASKNVRRLAQIGNGMYHTSFHGNITNGVAGTRIQLAIAFDGIVAPEAVGITTASAANEINNIGMETATKICCCKCPCQTVGVTVVNNGAQALILQAGATLLIERVG